MSEVRDPDAEHRRLIRAEHDRQRRNLIASTALATGLPGFMLTSGSVFAGVAVGVWFWLAIAGGVVSLVLLAVSLVLLGKYEPSGDTLRLAKATPWFEQIQRSRTTSMLSGFIPICALLPLGIGAAGDVISREGGGFRAINALICLVLVFIPVMILSGRDGSISSKMRKYLDDEHTREIRKRSMSSGFVTLMLGATAVYLVGLWRQELAVVMILPAIVLAAFVAVGRFALLERAAERGEGEDG